MSDYINTSLQPPSGARMSWDAMDAPADSSFAATAGSALDRRVESAHRLAMLALQSKRYSDDPEYRDAVDGVLSWSLPAWTAQCQAPNVCVSDARPTTPESK